MDRQQLKQSMADILSLPPHRLEDTAVLTDLVTDSFALIDMVIELQDEFDIVLVQDDLAAVKTVGELADAMLAKCPSPL